MIVRTDPIILCVSSCSKNRGPDGHISFHPPAGSVNTGDTDLPHQRKCPARHFRVASHDRARQGREVLVF
jgi:hypothetical protein